MARISSFVPRPKADRVSAHKAIEAKYSVFECDGLKLIQIDTFGSDEREIPGKVSQTIQLDASSASALYGILKREFGFS